MSRCARATPNRVIILKTDGRKILNYFSVSRTEGCVNVERETAVDVVCIGGDDNDDVDRGKRPEV